jgi:hypothetical protein
MYISAFEHIPFKNEGCRNDEAISVSVITPLNTDTTIETYLLKRIMFLHRAMQQCYKQD